MGFEIDIFEDKSLQGDYLEWLVDTQSADIQKYFGRLWDYYANPKVETTGAGATDRKVNESGRCYVQAQEYGLPARITGLMHTGSSRTTSHGESTRRSISCSASPLRSFPNRRMSQKVQKLKAS
jgi:hypothetical protein